MSITKGQLYERDDGSWVRVDGVRGQDILFRSLNPVTKRGGFFRMDEILFRDLLTEGKMILMGVKSSEVK